MLKKTDKRNQGFTIIEVLIVLAIAGMILLVVFLAIPALNRNNRNTQRKSEVASLLGAVNEYANNNNGVLPTQPAQQTAAQQNAKLTFYTGAISWYSGSRTNGTTKDTVEIVTGAACGTGSASANAVAGSARQVAVLYTVETGGGEQKVCQDS